MNVKARITNRHGSHEVRVSTDGNEKQLTIGSKPGGYGSEVNGGELLFAALATCYCNDLYREAAERNITITRVDVLAEGDFGRPGEPARNISYDVKVSGKASPEALKALIMHTDTVVEIQNTLRLSTPVLRNFEVVP